MSSALEALAARADVAIVLLATKAKLMEQAQATVKRAKDGETVVRADGSRTMKIGSMASLAAFVQGAGGPKS